MALNDKTKTEILSLIKLEIIKKSKELDKLINDIPKELPKKGWVKPFHESLFSIERIHGFSFFHSLGMVLGDKLFEGISKIIAKNSCDIAETQYSVEGDISNESLAKIREIINDLGRKKKDTKKRYPNISKEIQEVLGQNKNKTHHITQLSDVYLKKSGVEIFIEVKTVKPDKDQAIESKDKLLKIVAIKNKNIKLLLVFPYNPYFPDKYKWSFPLNYFKEGEDLLIGKEWWDYIGGAGTYEELLNIFEEAGTELRKDIEKLFKKYLEEISKLTK